jgi:hypothetical protein
MADGALVVPWRVSYIIELQTPEQIEALPDGTVLRSISGETAVKGSDPIDLDTRAGRTAWGMPDRREPIHRSWHSPGAATIATLRAALDGLRDEVAALAFLIPGDHIPYMEASLVLSAIGRAALATAKEAGK